LRAAPLRYHPGKKRGGTTDRAARNCIDRLARGIGDLKDIVRPLKARGGSLKATEQPIDTSTAAGKCFLGMLGVRDESPEGAPSLRVSPGQKPQRSTRAGRPR
jgi:Resolvase, N terminal domain